METFYLPKNRNWFNENYLVNNSNPGCKSVIPLQILFTTNQDLGNIFPLKTNKLYLMSFLHISSSKRQRTVI